jgi:glycosyltransferase involved in cell wall biosynthesis
LKVSALIPTYNRRTHIFRAIESILAQTVPVDEIIIVDDGSTDGTAEAIRSRYGSRVSLVKQENMGVSAARKRAIEEARTEWVAFLDSDDEWLPERNAELLRAASTLPPGVAWIFGNTEFVTDEGEGGTIFSENGLVIDQNPHMFKDPLSQLMWDHSRPRACVLESSLIRRSVLMELKCFSEGLRSSEDLLAGLQVASRYLLAAIPPIVTKCYRTSDLLGSSLEHNSRSSADRIRAGILGYALAARTAGSDPWGELYAESVRKLCKLRAQNGLASRRLALDQFKFSRSVRSVVFVGAAMLGPLFFRAGYAAKRKLRHCVAAGRLRLGGDHASNLPPRNGAG